MPWVQVYDPFHAAWLSTAAAALPIVVLLATMAWLQWRAQWAAAAGLATALVIAVTVFGMPIRAAVAATVFGGAYGLLPIGWVVVNAVLLYNITRHSGQFDVLRRLVATLSDDRRIQAIVIAFCFGAFVEGAAGFGTPVAITSALMIGLGFPPLQTAGLALIANTAPVAFGAIGTPILTLASVTGLPAAQLSAMAGRQLPFMSLLIPAWIVVAMSGWRGLKGVWPAAAVAGVSFAAVQFLWSNFIGPELVDIAGGLTSLAAVAVCCRVWRPAAIQPALPADPRRFRALVPWLFLSVFVLLWGTPSVKAWLNGGPGMPLSKAIVSPTFDVPGLHGLVYRDFPVEKDVADRTRLDDPAYQARRAEPARFSFNWLSATGTAILFASLASAAFLRIRPRVVVRIAGDTLRQMRPSLATIALMLALGYVTRYGGTDATLGLAFTRTGVFYPFFGTLVGWLGVAMTGSDTSSNVLFGSLQRITAQQLHLSPVLMCTANSTGGVMGKMIDAQSIVISTATTGQLGQEGAILRFVFWHSVALVTLTGLIVFAQAYWLQWMVPQ